MAIAIFPKRFTVKPPVGTQINWGHPLAKDLVGCWLFNEGGGASFINLANNSDFILLSGDASIGSDTCGIGLKSPSSSSTFPGGILSARSASLNPSSVSLFWRGPVNASTAIVNNPPLAGMFYDNSANAPYLAYGIGRRSGNANDL